jgi:hypothetical protein
MKVEQEARSLNFNLGAPLSADRASFRAFSISINGEPVWPVVGLRDASVEVALDDLLSYLAEFWKPLLLRQVYPNDFHPYLPSQIRAYATQRWNGLPSEIAEREEEAVLAFEDTHDLSRAFAGIFDLPAFWLMRAGDQFQCETQDRVWWLPLMDVVAALTKLGDDVALSLSEIDEKWTPLVSAWHRRGEGNRVKLLALSLGIDVITSEALVADKTLKVPLDFTDAVNDNDELRIAARLAGALPLEQVRQVLGIARQFAKLDTPLLADMAAVCSTEIAERWISHPPYVQGEVAARKVREKLGLKADDRIDVVGKLHFLGIAVRAEAIEPETLDGIAVWGPNHGPGVFLNLSSIRVSNGEIDDWRSDPALRVTLAHELCHLLLDGSHATSAVDVLKSRMPIRVEQRAKSFAGELLLPGRTAARWWQDLRGPTHREGLREVLLLLEKAFCVPRAVSAWKLDHGLQFLDVDLSAQLDSLSRYR